jgi:hypothetical protein
LYLTTSGSSLPDSIRPPEGSSHSPLSTVFRYSVGEQPFSFLNVLEKWV